MSKEINNEKTVRIKTEGSTRGTQNVDNVKTKKLKVQTKPANSPKNEKKPLSEKTEKQEKKYAKKKYGNSSLSAAMKTIIYISVVTVVSVVLGVFIVLAANDVFAFKKPEDTITVTFDEKPTIESIAEKLKAGDVIRFPELFKLYAKIKKKDNLDFITGTFTIAGNLNYDDLIYSFLPQKPQRETVVVTIPEGYSVDEIITLLISKGVGTEQGYIDAIENGEFDYWFLNELTPREGRMYRLEGYLYPDTYYFFTDASEHSVLTKMLDNFKLKVKKSWKKRCAELGLSFDDIVIIASIIQEEAKYPVDYPYVSSVFHNRLVNPTAETGGYIQSDATIQYYYRHIYGEKKAELDETDKYTESVYNTYLNPGLTPGPLSSPTITAINAAMYPFETSYYYFVTDQDGFCIYAKNYTEHLSNIKAIEEGKTAADFKSDKD